MALYPPPSKDLGIFDNSVFIHDDTGSSSGITPAYLDEHYLKYPNAQGTENLQTTNVNGLLSANNGLKIADGLNSTNIDMNAGELLFNNSTPSGTDGTYKFRCNDSLGTVKNPFEIRPNTINQTVDTLNQTTITTNTIASTAINMKAPTTKIETSTGVNGLLITPTSYTSYGNTTTMRDSGGVVMSSLTAGTTGGYYNSIGSNGYNFTTTGDYLSTAVNHTFRNGLTNIMALSTSNIVGTATTTTFNSSAGNPVMTLSASGSTITGQNLTLTTTDGISIKDSANNNNVMLMDMSGNNFISQITPAVGGGEGVYKFRARDAGTTIYTPLEVKPSSITLSSDTTSIGGLTVNIQPSGTITIGGLNTTFTTSNPPTITALMPLPSNSSNIVPTTAWVQSVISSLPSSTPTITDTNTSSTYYPVFVAGSGTQNLLADITTNPFSINPNLGDFKIASSVLVEASTQKTYFGTSTGVSGSNIQTTAIGFEAGNASQGIGNTAVGYQAGLTSQGTRSIAVGWQAGCSSQNLECVALGYASGNSNQGTILAGLTGQSVAVGAYAGQFFQGTNSIAIGYCSGQGVSGNINTYQLQRCVAIGSFTGQIKQQMDCIAIGYQAGQTIQGWVTDDVSTSNGKSIAIGYQAGQLRQREFNIAIGYQAGQTNQGSTSIAIGYLAGASTQGIRCLAIGQSAGQTTQGAQSIAIGWLSGVNSQGTQSVAIGIQAGNGSQGTNTVAVGHQAGQSTQGAGSVCIGKSAGNGGLGTNAIAIGLNAGTLNQVADSICLNASGITLNPSTASLYVRPIRSLANPAGSGFKALFYNPSTYEIVQTT
jgi:hypothetical protein